MNLKYLGTSYGGWEIDTDEIPNGSFIIDAGLGEDVSFLEELLQIKSINIIGIDPTEKSHRFIEGKKIENLTLLKKCIAREGTKEIKIFKNINSMHVSESYFKEHSSTNEMESYFSECISFKELIEKYNPSLIKMDIEGAEYDVLDECIGVKQICVEFHHHCISTKSTQDTQKCLDKMKSVGYRIISNRRDIEFTLLKD
jgi:FkbM family methyltransferase